MASISGDSGGYTSPETFAYESIFDFTGDTMSEQTFLDFLALFDYCKIQVDVTDLAITQNLMSGELDNQQNHGEIRNPRQRLRNVNTLSCLSLSHLMICHFRIGPEEGPV